jgi:hypothetical protein
MLKEILNQIFLKNDRRRARMLLIHTGYARVHIPDFRHKITDAILPIALV